MSRYHRASLRDKKARGGKSSTIPTCNTGDYAVSALGGDPRMNSVHLLVIDSKGWIVVVPGASRR